MVSVPVNVRTCAKRDATAHANANALSHLLLSETIPEGGIPPELVLLVDHLNSSPVTADQIREATKCDPLFV